VSDQARDEATHVDERGTVLFASDAAASGSPFVEVPVSYDAILLAGFGGPEGQEDVIPFLRNVTRGRGIPDEKGGVPQGVENDSTNNFQGRYIILHPWTGAVACEAPRRGVWGGPPPSQQIAAPGTLTASNTAFVPRGKVELGSLLAQDVPAIGATASSAVPLPNPIRKPQGCGCAATGGAGGALSLALGLLAFRRRRRD
jgi:MYXO-CTERM domain-containing protein